MSIELLIIDDDYSDLLMVQRILKKYPQPIHIKIAQTGKQGLEYIANGSFNIIIVDYKLPDINGLDILTTMQNNNCIYPVIFLTGYGNAEIIEEALNRGATYYLNKDLEEMMHLPVMITDIISGHYEKQHIPRNDS